MSELEDRFIATFDGAMVTAVRDEPVLTAARRARRVGRVYGVAEAPAPRPKRKTCGVPGCGCGG